MVISIGIIGYRNHAQHLITLVETHSKCKLEHIFHPNKKIDDELIESQPVLKVPKEIILRVSDLEEQGVLLADTKTDLIESPIIDKLNFDCKLKLYLQV